MFVDSHGQAVVYVGVDQWHDVAMFLRDDERFTQCVDVAAVDHLIDEDRVVPAGVAAERYEVVANFLSHPRNRRIRTICQVAAHRARGRDASSTCIPASPSRSARSSTSSASTSPATTTSRAS